MDAAAVEGVGFASPRDSVMASGVVSGSMASSTASDACAGSMTSSVAGAESLSRTSVSSGSLASRNANSGSVLVGSCLSFFGDMPVLNAPLEALCDTGRATHTERAVNPLGEDEDAIVLLATLLQALHTNLEGTDIVTLDGRG